MMPETDQRKDSAKGIQCQLQEQDFTRGTYPTLDKVETAVALPGTIQQWMLLGIIFQHIQLSEIINKRCLNFDAYLCMKAAFSQLSVGVYLFKIKKKSQQLCGMEYSSSKKVFS